MFPTIKGESITWPQFAIAMSNTYCLCLVMIFLSYGVVALPRKYLGMKNLRDQLSHSYFNVAIKRDELSLAEQELVKIVGILKKLKQMNEIGVIKFKKYKSYMKLFPEHINASQVEMAAVLPAKYEKCDLHAYEDLHRDTKKAISNYERVGTGLNQYTDEAIWLDELISSKDVGFKISEIQFSGRNTPCLGRFIWIWYCYLQQYVYFILGLLFALFSFMIVVGEMTIFFHQDSTQKEETIIKTFFFKTGYLSTNVTILIPLSYLCACTFYGLFKIKIFGIFSLNSHKQTDAFSLVMCSTIVTRLIPVLCYNFLQLTDIQGTAFEAFMGKFSTINMWGIVAKYIPYILLILIIMNIFNLWKLILQGLGLDKYTFVEPFSLEKSDEGRAEVNAMRKKNQVRKGYTVREHSFKSDSDFFESDDSESLLAEDRYDI